MRNALWVTVIAATFTASTGAAAPSGGKFEGSLWKREQTHAALLASFPGGVKPAAIDKTKPPSTGFCNKTKCTIEILSVDYYKDGTCKIRIDPEVVVVRDTTVTMTWKIDSSVDHEFKSTNDLVFKDKDGNDNEAEKPTGWKTLTAAGPALTASNPNGGRKVHRYGIDVYWTKSPDPQNPVHCKNDPLIVNAD